jgi:hypothetical protein
MNRIVCRRRPRVSSQPTGRSAKQNNCGPHLGATAEDDLALETLGVRGFNSAALGAALMDDSRDNEDMPTTGWFLNVNNLAYREALGGSSSFDAYRVGLRTFWPHGRAHVCWRCGSTTG